MVFVLWTELLETTQFNGLMATNLFYRQKRYLLNFWWLGLWAPRLNRSLHGPPRVLLNQVS